MNNRNSFLSIFSLFIVISALACSCVDDMPSQEELLKSSLKSVDKTKLQSDLVIIDDSLEQWNMSPLTEPNGVRYTIETLGTGKKPQLKDFVTIKYKGKLLTTKSVFDQSESATFQLSRLILGWQTTMPLLPEGTKATLYIPSGFAYGSAEIRDVDKNVIIPANSNLIFEIELIDVF